MKNTSEDIEKKIASIIRKELKNENYDDSCWLKAFSKADGDEQKAKVLYIELRTSDLKKEKQKEKQLEDLKTHSQMRCGRSFCNNAYKILSIPKTL
jgi:ribosome-binding factor A